MATIVAAKALAVSVLTFGIAIRKVSLDPLCWLARQRPHDAQ